MARRSDIPSFGVLAGLKVVHATLSTAGPFANEVMAEMGADVIWIESPLSPDVNRLGAGMAAESERRNQRNISLNIPTAEGQKVLFRLLKDTDIFIEASKGGQYEKWGLTDEVLWKVNPKLVIIHMSGFGQSGDPEFVSKACYDPIAQAFSGLMQLQGFSGMPPLPGHMLITDYQAGLFACVCALAALRKVQETGVGESVDLAQYEVAFRCQAQKVPDYFNLGVKPQQEGQLNARTAGWGVYQCKDGNYVYLICLGGGVLKVALPMLGLEFGSEEYPARQTNVFRATPAGEKMEQRVLEFCAKYTAEEMENLFWPAGVPCCRVMSYEDIERHPHYKARGSIVEWAGVPGSKYEGKVLRGAAIPMRFKNNPCQIWRGCPTIGMDNEDILRDVGFSQEEIDALYQEKVLFKEPTK